MRRVIRYPLRTQKMPPSGFQLYVLLPQLHMVSGVPESRKSFSACVAVGEVVSGAEVIQ